MVSSRREASDYLPLTEVAFEVLLALSGEEAHGYAIMQEVEERTGGRLVLRPGTLYRAVARLEKEGLITESSERPAPDLDDERRRYFRMTPLGHRVLKAEVARLSEALAGARAKKIMRST